MRRFLRCRLVIMVSLSALLVQAQTPARKPAPSTKRYCHPELDFCFRYPASWATIGEVFNSNGIVVAPPQKQEQSLWDTVTVGLVALPPEGDEEPANLNTGIEQASSNLRDEGQDFQTLQRQELLVDRRPAQMIKVSYADKSTGRDWIEELVFIEGPDNEIYYIGLKCSTQSLTRLEPALKSIVASWTLRQAAPPAEENPTKASPVKPAPPR